MNEELRQPSGHIKREKKGKDSALEDLMEFWGAWRANVIAGLSASSRSPITVAMEQYKPAKPSDIAQPKQTRTIQPKIPKYWPHHRMAQVNQVIWELQIQYQEILIHRYEDNWTANDFIREMNWSINTYYARISEARRAVKKHPVIRRILGRN